MSSFYPRHPRGWRLRDTVIIGFIANVSIHATLAGGDSAYVNTTECDLEFLSTPPSRVATA